VDSGAWYERTGRRSTHDTISKRQRNSDEKDMKKEEKKT
jgi:hypothetical protein